ncbi:UNVERIFIED_CONTAM: hypothetical protein GTU68_041742, partial [Idotea baltica]|nr:hypothetical protein [Idotea baltica]
VPQIEGSEHIITSNEVFYLEQQPQKAAIVGGGYIAVEFAGIFNGIGTDTSLVYRGPQILRGFDDTVRAHLANEIVKKGIDLKLNNNIEKITLSDDKRKKITFSDGSEDIVDCVLFATGRKPNTESLGLEKIGINMGDKKEILVDEYSRTNIDHIYAVGDVTDRIALTPVATMEGHAFADTVFGNRPRVADHTNVPSAVFSQPPVATVGLSEHDARDKHNNVDTYTSEFKILKHTLTENTERTLM